jgi:nicotinate-nucleotide adenylyltransferase
MRIGLFGGTFNPVHFGHLRTILEIRESFVLDRIYFIPSATPPHKTPEGIADAQDRYRMLLLAIDDQEGFVASDVELDRSGPSYSIDTVSYFQESLPEETRLFLILGLDAFLEIDTWRSFREFFDRVPIIVMARPIALTGMGSPVNCEVKRILKRYLEEKISDRYRFSKECSCYVHEEKQQVYPAAVTTLDISSTLIRKKLAEGKSIRYLTPDRVVSYIRSKGLYV